jgi:hypothetical protein
MASLRDYLYGYEAGSTIVPGEFTVWNTSTTTNSNGGFCCLWTVPTGITKAVFEIWSSGGSGGGACCCMQGGGAGSGGYGIKVCTVAAGQQIRICAAGSNCCGDYYCGATGCPSFVCSLGGGGQGTWLSCVEGGFANSRCVTCFYGSNCYTCCSMCWCCGGIGTNVDYYMPGTNGNGHSSQYCYDQYHQYSGTAYGTPGPRIGPNGCCRSGGSDGFGLFPGGGGLSAQTHSGGCCCGSPGAGGMIYVLYY